jgi:Protein of unknown function (DUF3108)
MEPATLINLLAQFFSNAAAGRRAAHGGRGGLPGAGAESAYISGGATMDPGSMIMLPRWRARVGLIAGGFALALSSAAQAQGTLTASYTISVARIPVGKLAWSAEISEDSYSISGSGETRGIASFLASGKGTLATRGTMSDGRLSPTEFSSDVTEDGGKLRQTMRLEQGNVTELVVDPPAPAADPERVPLTAAHREGVLDPLTAWLVPAAGDGDGLGREACERTLPVFDGQKRYDLKLAFKRMDKAKADKGYQGPALVCAVTFQPIAGHRPASATVRFLAPGRDIELWLAPVAGTRVLAPIRMQVANLLGNIVVQAQEFEAGGSVPARAAVAPK